MFLSALLLAIPQLAAASPAPAPAPCRAPAHERGAFVWLEREPARADSVLTLSLCLAPPNATGVGSFHLQVVYDTTRLTGASVSGTGAFVVANPARPGTIELAGADPHGFAGGVLARIELRRVAASPGGIDVRLLELNSTSGADLRSSARVVGVAERVRVRKAGVVSGSRRAPSRAAGGAAPHLDSIVPSHVHASPGVPMRVTIFGRGFTPTGNHVLVADQSVAIMDSPSGTSVAVVLSPWLPSHGEVPPRQLVPGSYPIRVRTAAGTSNAVPLIVENPQ